MHFTSILKRVSGFGIALWLMQGLSSCGNTRQLVYMQGQFDTAQLSQVNAVEPVIREGDILSIIVYSDNPEATKIYNQSLITTGSVSAGNSSSTASASGLSGASPSAPG